MEAYGLKLLNTVLAGGALLVGATGQYDFKVVRHGFKVALTRIVHQLSKKNFERCGLSLH